MPALKIDKKFVLGSVTVGTGASNVLVGTIDLRLLNDGEALFVIHALILGFRIGSGSTPYPDISERMIYVARTSPSIQIYSPPVAIGSPVSTSDLGYDTATLLTLPNNLTYTFDMGDGGAYPTGTSQTSGADTKVVAYVRICVNDL
jgi:hypothetical protein